MQLAKICLTSMAVVRLFIAVVGIIFSNRNKGSLQLDCNVRTFYLPLLAEWVISIGRIELGVTHLRFVEVEQPH